MNTILLVNLVGWAGATALLVAFALVSLRNYPGTSNTYQFLNIAGSLCLIVNTIYFGAYPSAFVNIVWIGIAFLSIGRRGKGAEAK